MESFHEDISGLLGGTNQQQMEELALKFLPDNMAVQINVFGTLVEGRIVSDLFGRLTITVKDSLVCGLNTQTMEEVTKPLKLVGGSG